MAKEEKKPLGRILLQQKMISQKDLDSALRDQSRGPIEGGKPLASRLTETGVVTTTDALRALSEQFGVPGIDLSQVAILLEHLDVVPREVAETQHILPVLVREDRIFLAMVDPNDKRCIDELEFVTGKKVYAYVAISTTLDEAIASAFEAKLRQDEVYYLGPNVPLETLRQLGIEPPASTSAHEPAARRAPSQRPTAPSIPPPQPSGPAVVVDDAIGKAGAEAELSDTEFGNMSEEVSRVMQLPEELRATAEVAKIGAEATSSGSRLILIVDDEEEIRKLLRRLLTGKGHRVVEADRGLLALRMVKERSPDLIILDAMLPELHGFDIARRIKGSEKYGAIPIIMVSAVYRGWRIAEDLKTNYGIEEYLEKPFKIADLLGAVERLLTQHTSPTVPPPPDPDGVSTGAEKALEDGIAAYKAGNIDLAIEHLKRGVGIDPLAYRLRYHLALLYGKRGQFYDGINELERAVDLNARHFPALKNLAVLYEKAGFKHKAVEMWERCVQNAPDDATRDSIKEHLLGLLY